jgi:hypothetical protein
MRDCVAPGVQHFTYSEAGLDFIHIPDYPSPDACLQSEERGLPISSFGAEMCVLQECKGSPAMRDGAHRREGELAARLCAQGHDSVLPADAGLLSSTDARVLTFAIGTLEAFGVPVRDWIHVMNEWRRVRRGRKSGHSAILD